MLEGSSIAAILTGVLALIGALATAWMSSWNEQRVQARENRKVLARYSVPLLIAAWDLASWFYDILHEDNYSPERCKAYGNGWNSQFTSYLLGQYFAGVHIVREKTYFLANIRGEKARTLKKLLWKIQDEFISMHYEGRESREMRWSEHDILAVQEEMTETCDVDADGNKGDMRTIGWVKFQQKYEKKESVSNDSDSLELKSIFSWYEDEFQRIIYRRFEHLYSTTFKQHDNPQKKPVQLWASLVDSERNEREDQRIEYDREAEPGAGMLIPDHRVRRLQHLLMDLVELLDEVSTVKLNRSSRKCKMLAGSNVPASDKVLTHGVKPYICCDCQSTECNPEQGDFEHRQLGGRVWKAPLGEVTASDARRTPSWDALGIGRRKTGENSDSQFTA